MDKNSRYHFLSVLGRDPPPDLSLTTMGPLQTRQGYEDAGGGGDSDPQPGEEGDPEGGEGDGDIEEPEGRGDGEQGSASMGGKSSAVEDMKTTDKGTMEEET